MNDEELKEIFTKSFKDMQRQGIHIGVKAICQGVLDRANNTKKTAEERIQDIVSFCEIPLKPKQ